MPPWLAYPVLVHAFLRGALALRGVWRDRAPHPTESDYTFLTPPWVPPAALVLAIVLPAIAAVGIIAAEHGGTLHRLACAGTAVALGGSAVTLANIEAVGPQPFLDAAYALAALLLALAPRAPGPTAPTTLGRCLLAALIGAVGVALAARVGLSQESWGPQ